MSLLWQVALSGQQLRALMWIRDGTKEDLPNQINHLLTSLSRLKREGLITHNDKDSPKWQITHKGNLALELAALDIGDFIKKLAVEMTPALAENPEPPDSNAVFRKA